MGRNSLLFCNDIVIVQPELPTITNPKLGFLLSFSPKKILWVAEKREATTHLGNAFMAAHNFNATVTSTLKLIVQRRGGKEREKWESVRLRGAGSFNDWHHLKLLF